MFLLRTKYYTEELAVLREEMWMTTWSYSATSIGPFGGNRWCKYSFVLLNCKSQLSIISTIVGVFSQSKVIRLTSKSVKTASFYVILVTTFHAKAGMWKKWSFYFYPAIIACALLNWTYLLCRVINIVNLTYLFSGGAGSFMHCVGDVNSSAHSCCCWICLWRGQLVWTV